MTAIICPKMALWPDPVDSLGGAALGSYFPEPPEHNGNDNHLSLNKWANISVEWKINENRVVINANSYANIQNIPHLQIMKRQSPEKSILYIMQLDKSGSGPKRSIHSQ